METIDTWINVQKCKMKILFLSILFVVFAKAQQPILQNNPRLGDSIFIDFKSAESAPIERVKHLIISCDKLDSINHNIIKFKKLKKLIFLDCRYTDAYYQDKLRGLELDIFEKHRREIDSINNAPFVPSKKYSSSRMFADWDSIYSSNKIVWISKELYDLKELESIEIDIPVTRKVKRFLKRYRRKTKTYVYIDGFGFL